MAKHPRNRGNRKPLVLLLSSEDKEIIKQLGVGTCDEDRHDALLNLMPIVKNLKAKPPKSKPEPIRLLLPEGFDDLLTARKKETKRSKSDLIVEAAKIYVEQKRQNAETPD